jgi:UTP-glucose-1-phosphate uridylyltransferase/galactokinase
MNMQRTIDLFVPGRVCLFGEHTDWAGGYRRFNSELVPGQVLLTGTNQGLYARATRNPDELVVHSCLPDGTRPEPFRVPMRRETLLREAEAGGFFSYAAGVAYHMLTFFEVKGLEIDNYRTDLPVGKGLSSSAAFCVLVARAFNRLYDLRLTVRAEMEAAYQGEVLTPSRCGRMDQGCAYGRSPVLMTFDGDLLKTRRVRLGGSFHLLVAELGGEKDTIRILSDLNRAYPFAADEAARRIQAYLGARNTELVSLAVRALEQGDPEALGALMTRAQAGFDRDLAPASPEQLRAPRLHRVLADPAVAEWVHGGKGVGSQGDGCVQFVTRGPESREALRAYLSETYGMACFDLDLVPPRAVRKAVIPVAGFGTRMFPASRAVKKELFPIITPDGVAKPVLLAIIEEALSAGIEEIALVVRAGDEPLFEEVFRRPVPAEVYNRLPEPQKRLARQLMAVGERLTLIPQHEPAGFGHAVLCAADWVGAEPFLLLLGDHLYASDTDESCAAQLLHAFESSGEHATVAVYPESAVRVHHYGALQGEWLNDDRTLVQVGEFCEKPAVDYARENLVTPGLEPDTFLCVFGQYVLPAAVFNELRRDVDADRREAGEIQLTAALESLRRRQGVLGYRVAGKHYDTGLPLPYLEALNAFAARRAPGNARDGEPG